MLSGVCFIQQQQSIIPLNGVGYMDHWSTLKILASFTLAVEGLTQPSSFTGLRTGHASINRTMMLNHTIYIWCHMVLFSHLKCSSGGRLQSFLGTRIFNPMFLRSTLKSIARGGVHYLLIGQNQTTWRKLDFWCQKMILFPSIGIGGILSAIGL